MSTTAFGDVTLETVAPHVALVEIHRPPENFFDTALVDSIATAYEAADADDDVRALVLGAEGKHFCAGARLAGRGNDDPTSAGSLYAMAVRMFSCRKPVVAAVQGAAVGGGLGVALSADFRVAAPESRFTANFARLGFHHGFGLTVTLPLVVGHQHALDLLYTGRRIGGADAHAIGMVDRLVAADEVRSAAIELAAEIAGSAPLAVESIRATMRGHLAEAVRRATDREQAEQDRLRVTHDFREGVVATAERREPRFERR